MGKEELMKLCRKYYPAFTFNDGLVALLVLLSVFIVASFIMSMETYSPYDYVKALFKMAAGWFGVFWVVGGQKYFRSISERARLRKLLADDWDAVPVTVEDMNCRKEKAGIYKRYIYEVKAGGIVYNVSSKIFTYVFSGNFSGYVIYPRNTDKDECGNGSGGIFIPC